MRGVPWKRPGPGHPERGRLHWWKSPLSHRPHHLRSSRRPGAGREVASRANFKPSACPSLPAPQSLLVHGAGRGPFADGPPYLPSCSPRSAPRRQPFPAHSVSGPGLCEAHHHLPGASPARRHQMVKRELVEVSSLAPRLSWAPSCANLPPGPGVSPGMCPRRQAPSLHS